MTARCTRSSRRRRTTHTVALPCRLLKAARSSFYAWGSGGQARRARQAADDAPAHEITVLHIASRHTYGAPPGSTPTCADPAAGAAAGGAPACGGGPSGSCASAVSPQSPGAGAGI